VSCCLIARCLSSVGVLCWDPQSLPVWPWHHVVLNYILACVLAAMSVFHWSQQSVSSITPYLASPPRHSPTASKAASGIIPLCHCGAQGRIFLVPERRNSLASLAAYHGQEVVPAPLEGLSVAAHWLGLGAGCRRWAAVMPEPGT
jgi:hypothetical protein